MCQHCGNVFTAKTTVTKFCSDDCAKKNYKLRKRQEAILISNGQTKESLLTKTTNKPEHIVMDQQELINIRVLSAVSSIGERTLYRLIKNKEFPKVKIGRVLQILQLN